MTLFTYPTRAYFRFPTRSYSGLTRICTAPSLFICPFDRIAISRGTSVSACKSRTLGKDCNPGPDIGIAENVYFHCWNGTSIGTFTCRLPVHENPSVISVCMIRLEAGVVGCRFVISRVHWKEECCFAIQGTWITACMVSVGIYFMGGVGMI